MQGARNKLAGEASPYLLHHAGNPVDWFPWGDEAFAEAAHRDLPVFLSVGYAACHWCHVMERESFVDPATAALLNQTFVCIKVDREERPDLDHLYMSVCQLLTGAGGWPLTVLLTPARLPFHAATYLPPRARGGRPGLDTLCAEVRRLWRDERPRLLDGALDLKVALVKLHDGDRGTSATGEETPGLAAMGAEEACRQLEQRHDARHGGFGGAPKFPSPHNLGLLLRRGWDEAAQTPRGAVGRRRLDMALGALLAMARGGLRDQLGGGFHRYSTDAQWKVPHFEKMLYDQATLCGALADGVQVLEGLAAEAGAGEAARLHAERFELLVALQECGDYVLHDLVDEAGGFHSAEDADSEGEEGRHYVWEWAELETLLDPADLRVAAAAWSLSPEGNWPDEATGRRGGRNVLCPGRAPAEAARAAGLETATFEQRLLGIRARLLDVRGQRVRPARDDKVLADWNGLLVAALARAAAPAGRPAWLPAAARCAGFLLDAMRRENGSLWHRWRGEPGIAGLLDDYAMTIRGLLELAQAGEGSRDWLAEAAALQAMQDRLFWDPESRLYRLSPLDTDLPLRPVEDHDGALPCGNSLAAGNLLRLARLLDQPEYRDRAADLTAGLAARSPLGAGQAQLLAEWEDESGRRELTLAGPDADARAPFRRALSSCFLPSLLVMECREARTEARLCLEGRCLSPAATPAELRGQLRSAAGRAGPE